MSESPRYQPEIDGLRAVAVVPVVIFHVGVRGLYGGFVGVDVFFVISGFLITRMLLAELAQTGRIDFLAFYARRVRRLLPALLLVVAGVLALGTFVLTAAGERQSLSQAALATVGFVSNIYFWWLQAGYFAGPAEWLPLLHMWTLSVEEQFYLLWPALMLLAAVLARRSGHRLAAVMGAMLALSLVASFGAAVWRVDGGAAFYLVPFRIWEFALGGALALPFAYPARWVRPAAAFAPLGLAAIALSVVTPDRIMPAGFNVPVAAIGAAAVIAGLSAAPATRVAQLLRAPSLVAIGKMSYSWYLWHWPLLVLVRIYDLGTASLVRDASVALGALVLAALTFAFVEDPIRRRKPWPFSTTLGTLASGATLSLTVAGLALALHAQADALLRRDPWLVAVYEAPNTRSVTPCPVGRLSPDLPPLKSCLIGPPDAALRLLVWGDSHAGHYVEMIREIAVRNNYAAVARIKDACRPFYAGAGETARLGSCLKFNAGVVEEIPALVRSGVTGVFLASRNYDDYSLADVKRGLARFLSIARENGLRVLVTAPTPVLQSLVPLPQCLAYLGVGRCGIDRAALEAQRGALVAALREVVAEFDNARLWDPAAALCDERVCSPVHDGVIYYAEANHLAAAGSRRLAPLAAADFVWLVHQDAAHGRVSSPSRK